MFYESLGDFLKALRIEKGWTQEEACNEICDRRNYMRWERNISTPSFYHINLLSKRFNYDLLPYYKFFICNQSLYVYECIQKAENCILNSDWTNLNTLIQEITPLQEFRYGENKENLCYYKALYFYEYKKNYNMSISNCIAGLKEEDITITIDTPNGSITTNIGLCLLNCLACNFNKINDSQKANNIFITILNSIDNKIIPEINYYRSNEFDKKLYQTVTHNLSLNCKRDSNYTEALIYANKGITFSLAHNYLNNLADLLEIKFKLLYYLGDYITSKQTYLSCVNLYLLQNRITEFALCKEIIHTEYPELENID